MGVTSLMGITSLTGIIERVSHPPSAGYQGSPMLR